MKLVVDVETNGIENPDKLWCVCTLDVDTLEAKEWTYETGYQGLQQYLGMADNIIGHNFLSFDAVYLKHLCNIDIEERRIIDTLVLSRLWHFKTVGGHSLETWGEKLNHEKIGLDVDFSRYSPDIVSRCRNDVTLNLKVYEFLKENVIEKQDGTFKEAIDVEHRMAAICRDMHRDGFGFDYDSARRIHTEISELVGALDTAILEAFPPKAKLVREYTPKETKFGTISKTSVPRGWTDLTTVSSGAPFSLVSWEEFNPGSSKQIVERLNQAGWKPVNRTEGHKHALLGFKRARHLNADGHRGDVKKLKTREEQAEQLRKMGIYGWKVDETNLATLPDTAPPAARLLVKRLMLAARLRTLNEWMEFYRESTHAIHGSFSHIGTVTHRMSHQRPNMGNVATKKTIKYNSPELRHLAIEYGGRMRALWRAREGCQLVGTDMESAHLRIFAHLIDDPEFTQSLISGRKEDETDPHSVNRRKLGVVCPDRDRAKTFIFSFLNGCAAPKVASIFDCSLQAGAEILREFTEAYPGLQRLKSTTIPADAKRGYFKGLDGRLVACGHEPRLLIGMYLQNAEAVIMKHANVRWQDELRRLHIKFRQVNLVHDEFVTEIPDDEGSAELVGRLQCSAIQQVGESFGLRCPLAGEYKTGQDWLTVH